MITITKTLELDRKWLEAWFPRQSLQGILLFDIETTGFSSKENIVYLIGCIYFQNEHFEFIQWLCEAKEDESLLLLEFSNFIKNYHTLIDYNGRVFDIPFLNRRFKQYQISCNLLDLNEIDLYYSIKPFHKHLPLENLKLKSVEKHFGYERLDQFNGGELIKTFHTFTASKSSILKSLLLLHNEEDLIGLFYALKTHQWLHFFESLPRFHFEQTTIQVSFESDFLKITLPFEAPFSFSTELLHFDQNSLYVTIPIFRGELKYFLLNYKDYYYLPAEDLVVHESIAQFVDRSNKKKANKQNAYIKKRGIFIPLLTCMEIHEKTYKESVNHPTTYIELSEDLDSHQTIIKSMLEYLLSQL